MSKVYCKWCEGYVKYEYYQGFLFCMKDHMIEDINYE